MRATMKPVTLYTTPICGYCAAAKHLLGQKGVSYAEIDVMADPSRRAYAAMTTAMDDQIGRVVEALERAGKLDALLSE